MRKFKYIIKKHTNKEYTEVICVVACYSSFFNEITYRINKIDFGYVYPLSRLFFLKNSL